LVAKGQKLLGTCGTKFQAKKLSLDPRLSSKMKSMYGIGIRYTQTHQSHDLLSSWFVSRQISAGTTAMQYHFKYE